MKFPNRVREARVRSGYTREEVAQAVGVTRQTVGLIETGRVSPSTSVSIRLARLLDETVESLFGDEAPLNSVAHYFGPVVSSTQPIRVATTTIAGVEVARALSECTHPFSFQAADGLVHRENYHGNTVSVRSLGSEKSHQPSLFLSGCDLSLGLLAEHVSSSGRTRGLWFNASNHEALSQVMTGVSHIASLHIKTELVESPEQIHPFQFPLPHRLYTVARSQIGWVLPHGNPKSFDHPGELSTGALRFVNRPRGAGTRGLLDQILRDYNVSASQCKGYEIEMPGHAEVVSAIAHGLADVGIATESAAATYGLHFIPIQTESTVLVIPERHLDDERVQVMLDRLTSSRFREELRAFGAYDVKDTGSMQ